MKLQMNIFNAVEKSRIEANGSILYKGVGINILNKHSNDLNSSKLSSQIQMKK